MRLSACILKRIGNDLYPMRESGMSAEVLIGVVVAQALSPQESRRRGESAAPPPELLGAYVAATKNILTHLAEPPRRGPFDRNRPVRPGFRQRVSSTA